MAAAGSCLAVTIAALAEREQLPVRGLSVRADGVVGHRPDGRFGFVRIEQTVELETEPGHERAARAMVAKAEDSCLVTVSLALPRSGRPSRYAGPSGGLAWTPTLGSGVNTTRVW